MAADLDRYAASLQLNPQYLAPVLTAQAAMRGLTEAADPRPAAGTMLARTGLVFGLGFEDVSQDALRRAQQGEVVIMTDDREERVRALVRLNEFSDLFLYVGRYHRAAGAGAPREHPSRGRAIRAARRCSAPGFQITFAVIYILVAMLFLAAAILIGVHFAAQMADPISGLVGAADRVRAGDLSARVPEGERDDELSSLSRAFNRMTYQIQSQQRELIEANRELDERRRFTETVLTGVSAGVIGLDRGGRVYLPNRSASALLGIDLDRAIGEDLAELAPEMAELLERGGAAARTGWRKARCRSPARTARARCWSASPPSATRTRSAASSSPSTTSPSCCRRSARPPGPISPAASRTRSRTR